MLVRRQKIRINLSVLFLFSLLFLPVVFIAVYLLEMEHEETLARYSRAVAAATSSEATSPVTPLQLALIEETSRTSFRKRKIAAIALIIGAGLFTGLFTTFILMRRILLPFLFLGEQIREIGSSPAFTGRVRLEAVGEFGDVTAAFNRQMELLEEKDRQLFQSQQMELAGLMAGGMAHEFNTVLTAILGFAHIVEKRLSPQDENLQYVEHIIAACNRGKHLTRNLMRLQRDGTVTPERVSVGELVREVARSNAKIIGDQVTIEVTPLSDNLYVLGDRHFLYQVFMNLVANARDAMPNGGVITISADVVQVDADRLGGPAVKKGAFIAVSLADTGVGMDQGVLRRIFHPFFTTKEVGKGSGLGLSVSYAIVSEHGGFITVATESGQGTAVVVHLPLLQDGRGPTGGETSSSPACP